MNTIEKVQINSCKRKQAFNDNTKPKIIKTDVLAAKIVKDNSRKRKQGCIETKMPKVMRKEQSTISSTIASENWLSSYFQDQACKLINNIEKVEINSCKRKQAFKDSTRPKIINIDQATDVDAAKIVKDNSRKRKQCCIKTKMANVMRTVQSIDVHEPKAKKDNLCERKQACTETNIAKMQRTK
ncbi:MAG: hypothetical protein GY697_09420, partial [Desulfobacterales bacterium]|nr:hypothetical protein [Desulfobacterales bacterium]